MKKILIGLLLSALIFSLAACGGTGDPSVQPSKDAQPTTSAQPSAPTGQPTHAPSTAPTETPTTAPTTNPSAAPTGAPAETVKVALVSDGNEQIVSVPVGKEIGALPAAEKENMDLI